MNDNILTHELCKRIFYSLGFSERGPTGQGLSHNSLVLDRKIIIEDDEGTSSRHSVFAGQVSTDLGKKLEVIVTDLPNEKLYNYALYLRQDDAEIGINFEWIDNDPGFFLAKNNKKWLAIGLIYKLNLTVLFETIREQGMLWEWPEQGDELYDNLVSFLDVESDLDERTRGVVEVDLGSESSEDFNEK